jgi:hypothetical protein
MLGLVGGVDSSRGRVPVERLEGAPDRIDRPEPGAQSVAVEPVWACCCSALTLSLNGAPAVPLSGPVHSLAGCAHEGQKWSSAAVIRRRDNAAQHARCVSAHAWAPAPIRTSWRRLHRVGMFTPAPEDDADLDPASGG